MTTAATLSCAPSFLAEQLLDPSVVERVAQPVGAEQVHVPRERALRPHRHAHRLLHAEGARHDVPRHLAEQRVVDVGVRLQHVHHERMVHGERLEQPTPQPVAAAVADLRHVRDVAVGRERERHERRAHPLVLRRLLGDLDDLGVGSLDGSGEPAGHRPEAEGVDLRTVTQ
jgi:hypothetical protein